MAINSVLHRYVARVAQRASDVPVRRSPRPPSLPTRGICRLDARRRRRCACTITYTTLGQIGTLLNEGTGCSWNSAASLATAYSTVVYLVRRRRDGTAGCAVGSGIGTATGGPGGIKERGGTAADCAAVTQCSIGNPGLDGGPPNNRCSRVRRCRRGHWMPTPPRDSVIDTTGGP